MKDDSSLPLFDQGEETAHPAASETTAGTQPPPRASWPLLSGAYAVLRGTHGSLLPMKVRRDRQDVRSCEQVDQVKRVGRGLWAVAGERPGGNVVLLGRYRTEAEAREFLRYCRGNPDIEGFSRFFCHRGFLDEPESESTRRTVYRLTKQEKVLLAAAGFPGLFSLAELGKVCLTRWPADFAYDGPSPAKNHLLVCAITQLIKKKLLRRNRGRCRLTDTGRIAAAEVEARGEKRCDGS